jgi:FkbM family methyltransferase
MRVSVNTKHGRIELAYELDPTKHTHRVIRGQTNALGFYEPATAWLLLRALDHGDTFVDVGAHCGVFTVLASRLVGVDGKVVAIEGDEENFRHLQRHVAINDIGNADLICRVLAASEESRDFWTNTYNDGGHALWDTREDPRCRDAKIPPTAKQVHTISLDTLLRDRGIRSIRCLKVDTEGAEHEVLRGASGMLGPGSLPLVLAEINEFGLTRLGTSQMDFRRFMREHGYATFYAKDDGTRPRRLPDSYRVEPPDELYAFNLLFAHEDEVERLWPSARA